MEATTCRLRPLLRTLLHPPSSHTQHQIPRFFSSSSRDGSCRSRRLFDDTKERSTGSYVYQHTLKTQRPSTIRRRSDLENSVSFIGAVNRPIKTVTTRGGILFAYTHLKVDSSSGSNKFLTILLNMWQEMAELSIQHLKLNDYIYVSGLLRSFTRACDNGNIILNHKVLVKEINFVANNNQKNKNMQDSGELILEKHRNRLHLWQVFFANPHEWQDLRKRKVNPKHPDFIHKGSGEALWLGSNDPPWIIRQLKLQDLRMGEMGFRHSLNYLSNLSPLSYNHT